MQLLQKLSIRANNGPDKLLRVIKQPVTTHLPTGARRVGLSHAAPSLHRLPGTLPGCSCSQHAGADVACALAAYVAALPEGAPIVFIVGAMAHGHVDVSYTDDFISVSEFPLSAACCIGRICNALEAKFDIV